MAPAVATTTKKQEYTSADAFEDDFVEEDLHSDSNQVDEEDAAEVTATNDDGIKRKREANDNAGDVETTPKKKKNKKKKKTTDPYQSMQIWKESPVIQAEYLGDRLKQALPTLTSLEKTPMTAAAIVDNSKFKQEHTMEGLPNYIKFAVMRHKKLTKKPVGFGAPLAIVVTHSAIRAADLSRGLKEFSQTARILKLFAKHIKIEEQAELLKTTPVHLAVGTPQRLLTLAEQGHLKLDELEVVILDTDTTKGNYNLMELLSGREALFTFLNTYIAPRMKDGTSKLALF